MSLFARALFQLSQTYKSNFLWLFIVIIFETSSTVERLAPRRGALTDWVPCCSVSGASRAHREGRPTLRAAPPPQTNAQTCPPTHPDRSSRRLIPEQIWRHQAGRLPGTASVWTGQARLGSGVHEKLRETFDTQTFVPDFCFLESFTFRLTILLQCMCTFIGLVY